MDDWSFLFFHRLPIPLWGAWNPTRVLPELLMPWTAWLSVKLIYPFTHELIGAIEIGMAATVSFFVTIYAALFCRMMRKKYDVDKWHSFGIMMIFLLLHLLVFRSKTQGNDHLLAGYYDATTYFFYLIPALWNASLVLYLISERYFITRQEKPIVIRLLVLIACYMAILSNLYQSIILVAYTFADLLYGLLGRNRTFSFKSYIAQELILLFWLVAMIFEFFGGRAASLTDQTFNLDFLKTAKILLNRLSMMNSGFIILFAAAIVGCVFRIYKRIKNEQEDYNILREILCYLFLGIVILFYELLVCSASRPDYVQRGDVLISAFFYIILFMCTTGATSLQKHKKTNIFIPVIVVFCMIQTLSNGNIYLNRTNSRVAPETARAITKDIVTQMQEANEKETCDTILVPKYATADNWPIAYYGAPVVSWVLAYYELIDSPINIAFEGSYEKNIEFGIKIPNE